MAREKAIEAYLRDEVKKLGGTAYKFVSPGNAGVPDRLVLLPGGKIEFVELKAPGKEPTALQKAQATKLRALGFKVHVISSRLGVDVFMNMLLTKGDSNEIHTTRVPALQHKSGNS